MKSQLREQAIKLRVENNLSYGTIRKRLGVSKSTLSYWLKEFPLSEKRILELRRRGWKKGEANRERFRFTMRKKQELKEREIYNKYKKKFAKLSKNVFFVAGLMLYLGEGGKKDYGRISLANTDPKIIKFFIKWLGNFFNIGKEKVKIQLHLYENMGIEKEQRFWRNILELPKNQFYKPEVRKLQKSSFSYRESFRHGTCSIFVASVEKKRKLMAAIQAFLDRYMKS